MNFCNSRKFFGSFMRNQLNNKFSQKYFNTSINSKKSLINFSNNFSISNLLTLSRIISSINYSSLLRFTAIQAESEQNITTLNENASNQSLLSDIKSLFWNEICMIKTSNFFI